MEKELKMSEGFQNPIPCPAGECDAQIYNVKNENLAFCPKCNARNPNFTRVSSYVKTRVTRTSNKSTRARAFNPTTDLETGIVKW